MARLLFKLAVEMSMMLDVLTSTVEIDEALLQKLEGYLLNRLKVLNW